MKRSKKISMMVFAVALSLLTACGGKDDQTQSQPAPAPNPTVPTPTNPTINPSSGKVEVQSPGTPLCRTQDTRSAFENMNRNLRGNKIASVVQELAYNYIVTNPYSETPQFALGPNPKEITSGFTVPSYQIQSYGDNDRLTLVLNGGQYERQRRYEFEYTVEIDGLILYSTEVVALFRSADANQTDFLKVLYASPTPAIQRFIVDEYGYYNSKINWSIFQQNMITR